MLVTIASHGNSPVLREPMKPRFIAFGELVELLLRSRGTFKILINLKVTKAQIHHVFNELDGLRAKLEDDDFVLL